MTGPVHPWLRAETRREAMIAHSRTWAARLANEIRVYRAARWAERRSRRMQRAEDWRQWRAMHAGRAI